MSGRPRTASRSASAGARLRASAGAFVRGGGYALRGIKEFFRWPRLWGYALIPLVSVTIVFFLICRCVMAWLVRPAGEWLQAWVVGWAGETAGEIVLCCLLVSATLLLFLLSAAIKNDLYELFGSLFFARMVRRYEELVYHRPDPRLSLGEEAVQTLSCVVYAAVTLVLALVFFVLGFLLPGVAQVLTVLVLGRRYGIGYCAEAGFNRRLSLSALQRQFRGRRLVLYGFGTMCFLILLVPLVSTLFIPGLCIGGTILVNEECGRAEWETDKLPNKELADHAS